MIELEEMHRIACEVVGVIPANLSGDPTADWLALGTFQILDSPAAYDAVAERYLWALRNLVQEWVDDFQNQVEVINAQEEWGSPRRLERMRKLESAHVSDLQNTARKKSFLSYADFIKFQGREDTEGKRPNKVEDWRWRRDGMGMIRENARRSFAGQLQIGGYPATRAGYERYLKVNNKELYDQLSTPLPVLIPEEPRRTHSYIVSTTKTGKSELIKAMALSYVNRPDYCSLVILDPGGDMCQQIARWPELIPQGRLVYLDPTLSPQHTPTLNPLDAEGMNEAERTVHAGQVISALGALIEGKLGGALSVNMETVLRPSIRLLVDTPGSTLEHLIALMRGDESWLELGRRSPRQQVANFFQNEFDQLDNLASSKQAIAVKIRNIVDTLGDLVCGRSTVNLEEALANRKVVLVNLAPGLLDPASARAFGTLLVAMVQSIAMRRAKISEASRPMTHLVIDECQNFVTPELKTIIRETRKFGLALTLAQQEVGGEMPKDIRDVVIKTTNVKIAGRSDISETRETAELVGVAAENIAILPAGQFYYRNGGTYPAFKLNVRSDRIGFKGGVSHSTWQKIRSQQLRFFYRNKQAGFAIGSSAPVPVQASKENEADLTGGKPQPTSSKKYKFE